MTRSKFSRTRRRLPAPLCAICGGAMRPEFAFDASENEDGRVWVHPDCYAYTHSGDPGSTSDVPSRPLAWGQRLVHTCGNPLCLNPAHLEVE